MVSGKIVMRRDVHFFRDLPKPAPFMYHLTFAIHTTKSTKTMAGTEIALRA